MIFFFKLTFDISILLQIVLLFTSNVFKFHSEFLNFDFILILKFLHFNFKWVDVIIQIDLRLFWTFFVLFLGKFDDFMHSSYLFFIIYNLCMLIFEDSFHILYFLIHLSDFLLSFHQKFLIFLAYFIDFRVFLYSVNCLLLMLANFLECHCFSWDFIKNSSLVF